VTNTRTDDLIRFYPRVYHMAEAGSWPSIRENGLLSTTALLDLFQMNGSDRYKIESQWRPKSVTITHPDRGSAVIRDQKPLPEATLQKLVDGMSAREYYELLNRKTFFWVRRERLERLLNARAYKGRAHTVLTVDTEALLRKHQGDISLSHINSGAAIYGTGRRGAGTFERIAAYPFEELKRKKREDAVVELAVDYSVKDISELALKVEEWIGGMPLKVICERANVRSTSA